MRPAAGTFMHVNHIAIPVLRQLDGIDKHGVAVFLKELPRLFFHGSRNTQCGLIQQNTLGDSLLSLFSKERPMTLSRIP